MSAPSIVPRRPARKADIDRALKAAKDAGLHVSSIKIGPNGEIEVLTGIAPAAQRDELEDWRGRRDARKAERA